MDPSTFPRDIQISDDYVLAVKQVKKDFIDAAKDKKKERMQNPDYEGYDSADENAKAEELARIKRERGKSCRPQSSVGSQARQFSRRIRVMKQHPALINVDPDKIEDENEREKVAEMQRRRFHQSRRHNNPVQERMAMFGGQRVIRRTIRKSASNSQTQEGNDDNTLQVSQGFHQRESVRNIKTSLGDRRRMFLSATNVQEENEARKDASQENEFIARPGRLRKSKIVKFQASRRIKKVNIETDPTNNSNPLLSRKKKISSRRRVQANVPPPVIVSTSEDSDTNTQVALPPRPRKLRMSKISRFQTQGNQSETGLVAPNSSPRLRVRKSVRHSQPLSTRVKMLQEGGEEIKEEGDNPEEEELKQEVPVPGLIRRKARITVDKKYRDKYYDSFKTMGEAKEDAGHLILRKNRKSSKRIVRMSVKNLKPLAERMGRIEQSMAHNNEISKENKQVADVEKSKAAEKIADHELQIIKALKVKPPSWEYSEDHLNEALSEIQSPTEAVQDTKDDSTQMETEDSETKKTEPAVLLKPSNQSPVPKRRGTKKKTVSAPNISVETDKKDDKHKSFSINKEKTSLLPDKGTPNTQHKNNGIGNSNNATEIASVLHDVFTSDDTKENVINVEPPIEIVKMKTISDTTMDENDKLKMQQSEISLDKDKYNANNAAQSPDIAQSGNIIGRIQNYALNISNVVDDSHSKVSIKISTNTDNTIFAVEQTSKAIEQGTAVAAVNIQQDKSEHKYVNSGNDSNSTEFTPKPSPRKRKSKVVKKDDQESTENFKTEEEVEKHEKDTSDKADEISTVMQLTDKIYETVSENLSDESKKYQDLGEAISTETEEQPRKTVTGGNVSVEISENTFSQNLAKDINLQKVGEEDSIEPRGQLSEAVEEIKVSCDEHSIDETAEKAAESHVEAEPEKVDFKAQPDELPYTDDQAIETVFENKDEKEIQNYQSENENDTQKQADDNDKAGIDNSQDASPSENIVEEETADFTNNEDETESHEVEDSEIQMQKQSSVNGDANTSNLNEIFEPIDVMTSQNKDTLSPKCHSAMSDLGSESAGLSLSATIVKCADDVSKIIEDEHHDVDARVEGGVIDKKITDHSKAVEGSKEDVNIEDNVVTVFAKEHTPLEHALESETTKKQSIRDDVENSIENKNSFVESKLDSKEDSYIDGYSVRKTEDVDSFSVKKIGVIDTSDVKETATENEEQSNDVRNNHDEDSYSNDDTDELTDGQDSSSVNKAFYGDEKNCNCTSIDQEEDEDPYSDDDTDELSESEEDVVYVYVDSEGNEVPYEEEGEIMIDSDGMEVLVITEEVSTDELSSDVDVVYEEMVDSDEIGSDEEVVYVDEDGNYVDAEGNPVDYDSEEEEEED